METDYILCAHCHEEEYFCGQFSLWVILEQLNEGISMPQAPLGSRGSIVRLFQLN